MSFNVRRIDKNIVLSKFNNSGIEGVIDLFSNPDALILSDETSTLIHDEIRFNNDDKETRILEYINKIENL